MDFTQSVKDDIGETWLDIASSSSNIPNFKNKVSFNIVIGIFSSFPMSILHFKVKL